jgi:hypothetical protein
LAITKGFEPPTVSHHLDEVTFTIFFPIPCPSLPFGIRKEMGMGRVGKMKGRKR